MSSDMSSAGVKAKICRFSCNVITWTVKHSTTVLCSCCQGNGGLNSTGENPAVKLEGNTIAGSCSVRHSIKHHHILLEKHFIFSDFKTFSGVRGRNFAIISKHKLWKQGVGFPVFIACLIIYLFQRKKDVDIFSGKRKDFFDKYLH